MRIDYESGASNAFLVVLRLGMEQSIIEDVHEIAYDESKDYSNLLSK